MNFIKISVIVTISVVLGMLLSQITVLSAKLLTMVFLAFALIILTFAARSLKTVLLGVLVFSFCTQLDFNPWYSTYYVNTNAGIAFSLTEMSLWLLYLLWFFEIFSGKQKFIKTTPDIFILLFLVFYSAISFFISTKISFTILQFPKVIAAFLIYYYARGFTIRQKNIDFIINIVAISILFSSIAGIGQFFFKGLFDLPFIGSADKAILLQYSKSELFRSSGFLGHPNIFADFLICWIPLMFFVFSISKDAKKRYLCLSAYLFGVIALILTFSRGGWIAFVVAQLFAMALLIIRKKDRINSILIKAVVVVSLLLLAALPFAAKIYQRLTYYDFGAGLSRLSLIGESLELIFEHPFVGMGLGYFMNFNPAPVHNIYLHIASEMGVPALVLFLWFLFKIFKKGISNLKCSDENVYIFSSGLVVGFLAFCLHGLFEPGTIGHQRFLLIFFISGLIASINMAYNSSEKQRHTDENCI
ncbi:MAG: O-antigen ligase family protein [Candidatus Omnitrophota bacterium]